MKKIFLLFFFVIIICMSNLFATNISSYINNNVSDAISYIDSENYSNVFKELYIESLSGRIYNKKPYNNVAVFTENIPEDNINLRIMNISRKRYSASSGRYYWSIVFNIKTPLRELAGGKYYAVKDSNGAVQYTQDENFYIDIFDEEINGVIDEEFSFDIIIYESDGEENNTYSYRMKLYAIVDWSQIGEGGTIHFYPRNMLDVAYEINASPQIKEHIEEKESYLPIQLEANTALNLSSENKIMLYGASLCSNSYPWFKEWLEIYTGADVINAGNPGWNAKQLSSTDYYNKVEGINPDVIYVMLGGNDAGDDVGTFGAIETQTLVEEIPLTESWSYAESGGKEYKFIQCLDYILRKLKDDYYVNANSEVGSSFPYIVVGTFTPQHREGWQFIKYNYPQNWLNKRNAIVECANKNNLPCIDVFSNIGIDWDNEPYYNQDLDYNAATGIPTLVNRGVYTLDGLHLNEYGFEKLARLLSDAFTGVEDNKLSTSKIKVIAGKGIEVAEYYGNLRIVNLVGQVVKDLHIDGSAQIELPKGVYIVVQKSKSQKVVI